MFLIIRGPMQTQSQSQQESAIHFFEEMQGPLRNHSGGLTVLCLPQWFSVFSKTVTEVIRKFANYAFGYVRFIGRLRLLGQTYFIFNLEKFDFILEEVFYFLLPPPFFWHIIFSKLLCLIFSFVFMG